MELNYEIREVAPRRLAFERDGGRAALTFPLPSPRGVYLSVGAVFVAAAAKAILFAQLARMIWPVTSPSPLMCGFIGIAALSPFAWGLLGWWMIRSYRRHGHLCRKLWVDRERRVLGHRLARAGRGQEWALSEVLRIWVTPVRHPSGSVAGEITQIQVRGRNRPLVVAYEMSDARTVRQFVDLLTPLVRQPTSLPPVGRAQDTAPRNGAITAANDVARGV